MSDARFLCGTIYWPLLPLEILRSEMVPFLSSKGLLNEERIICPFINGKKCLTPRKSNGSEHCFQENPDNNKCCYYEYHKYFLLIRDDVKFPDCVQYVDNKSDRSTSYSDLYRSEVDVSDLRRTLCYFPQYRIANDPLKGFDTAKKGTPKNVFFKHRFDSKLLANKISGLDTRGKLYAKSEYELSKNMADSDASSSAFNKLTKIEVIRKRLPNNTLDGKRDRDFIHPVVLSFFADKRADALLSLVIRHDKTIPIDSKTIKLIEQALGSIQNEIFKQRQEFLEKWCMTLGERVDGIYQGGISRMSDKDDDARHKAAKQEAMQFAFEAICEMAKILAIQKPTAPDFPKNASPGFTYDPQKLSSGQISTYIEQHDFVIKKPICSDRRNYIMDFCRKAEMYAEEFVASEGKLKGRLSALTVRKLKKISLTSNPVNARILIRGKPGGGKGVTADDFHFYCMKKIAEEIQNIEEDWIKNIIENIIDTLGEQGSADANKKMDELRGDPCEFLKKAYPKPLEKLKGAVDKKFPPKEEYLKTIVEIKDRIEKIVEAVFDGLEVRSDNENSKKDSITDLYTYLIEHSEYLKEIEKRLKAIFKLPANYSISTPGASAILFFRQISNTGWWLWDQSTNASSLKKDIDELLKIQKEVIDKSTISTGGDYFKEGQKGHEDYLIKEFTKLLKRKIIMEIESEKPDFSFNLLQVNCGILGGENSELTESIARLFGKCGNYDTAIPGLFQTCSYMGGTLFLDEIADCPVRVQDNLLKPLEEGTVSRPDWETFDEKVDNIRVVGATFKDLFKLAKQYEETFPSGNPKGFRPDLLTRLTRNPPVSVRPISHYFVPTEPIDSDFKSQFAFVCNSTWVVSTAFWGKVYDKVFQKIDEHVHKARYHIPDVPEGRRKFASKITMRLFKEVGKIAQLNNNPKLPDNNFTRKNKALEYLDRMLDYLLVETS